MARETRMPTCWTSGRVNSPICHKTCVVASLALNSSGKFISTRKWFGTAPSICVTQSKISTIAGSDRFAGLTRGMRATAGAFLSD